jgi:hypothetical protein
MNKLVIPAKAGIPARQRHCQVSRDPGLRRGDGLLGPS